jgi:hypothetical protein
MEITKGISIPSVISLIIGIIGLSIGAVLDIDAHSLQLQISAIVESVKSINTDQKVQDINIENNTISIEIIKQEITALQSQ